MSLFINYVLKTQISSLKQYESDIETKTNEENKLISLTSETNTNEIIISLTDHLELCFMVNQNS